MQVVVLCGGLGTRLREETEVIPKPMVEIGEHPILWHILKQYDHHGFNDFVLCLGYKGDRIRDYVLNYSDRSGDLTVDTGSGEVRRHETEPPHAPWRITLADTGQATMTGGRIKRAERYIEGDTFMATYGDGVSDVDIEALLAHHRRMGRLATVTAVRPAPRFGRIDIDDDGIVRNFQEKPNAGEGWINGGFFVFERGIFDYLSGDDCILERDPLERLAADGQLSAYRHPGFWQPMDTIRDRNMLRELWEGSRPWATWEHS